MKYGETPWDKLSREELLREVQRMAAALVAARGVMHNSRFGNKTLLYWRDGGSGRDAIDKTDAALQLYDKAGDETCYRAFFRYADDLLFPPARPELGWMYCETCKDMIKNTTLGIEIGRACYQCKAPRRPLTWADLAPVSDESEAKPPIEPKLPNEPKAPKRYVCVDYYAESHRPYQNMIHCSEFDAVRDIHHVVADAMSAAGLADGDEFFITLTKTGRRPFGDRKMVLVEPHMYRRET